MTAHDFMNEYLNTIAEETFSSFDTGAKPSEFGNGKII